MIDLNIFDRAWTAPQVPDVIPQGDMPGDRVIISETHIKKANVLFPPLLREIAAQMAKNPHQRVVITVCGGSGVGKSETASLISYYLNQMGVGAYTLSGDNYPHRIPMYNDAERMRVFRTAGLKGLLASGTYEPAQGETVRALWAQDMDAAPASVQQYPWLRAYQLAGRAALARYLGTDNEQDFPMLEGIVASFKRGADTLLLKRMGRTEDALWYEPVDMKDVHVLVIEWTHGNSDGYQGVDIPILLNSTPSETLAHRKARNRDGKTDSPFTTMVLEIEQNLLESQAHKAKFILSKAGEIISYAQYLTIMAKDKEGQHE